MFDVFGRLPGRIIQQADAEQAYVQAALSGLEIWFALPPEVWPPEWKNKGWKTPVARLVKALYGHPDSGGPGKSI
eukprot:11178451-Lingulodinium_polyedra.AAC.1